MKKISWNDFMWLYIYRPISRMREGLSNLYYKHRKKVYRCSICGLLEAPFLYKRLNSLTHEFGWKQFKSGGWVCHKCLCHYGDKTYTEGEWEEYVKEHNKKLRLHLKAYK